MSSMMIINAVGFPLQVPMTIIQEGKQTTVPIYFDDIVEHATSVATEYGLNKVLLVGTPELLEPIADEAREVLCYSNNTIEIEVIEG